MYWGYPPGLCCAGLGRCWRCTGAHTPHEQGVLQAQIAATDRQIDRLVYALYGLIEEEIRIVEGG